MKLRICNLPVVLTACIFEWGSQAGICQNWDRSRAQSPCFQNLFRPTQPQRSTFNTRNPILLCPTTQRRKSIPTRQRRPNQRQGQREWNYTRADHAVVLENLTGKEDLDTLDTGGFQLFKQPGKYTTFDNGDKKTVKEYYPQSIELIEELTRASRLVHGTFLPTLSHIHKRS